jgi:hypothetical protein
VLREEAASTCTGAASESALTLRASAKSDELCWESVSSRAPGEDSEQGAGSSADAVAPTAGVLETVPCRRGDERDAGADGKTVGVGLRAATGTGVGPGEDSKQGAGSSAAAVAPTAEVLETVLCRRGDERDADVR